MRGCPQTRSSSGRMTSPGSLCHGLPSECQEVLVTCPSAIAFPPITHLCNSWHKYLTHYTPVFQTAFMKNPVASPERGSLHHRHLFPERCQYHYSAEVRLQRVKIVSVLGNGGSEGTLGNTGQGDVLCLGFLGGPQDVAVIKFTRCWFCRLSWFLVFVLMGRNIVILKHSCRTKRTSIWVSQFA